MKKFPDIIPVFPLSGVIYFPNTNLPLNIFEERYLKLVDDTYRRDKLMGMVQSQKMENKVYNIGRLGDDASGTVRKVINFINYKNFKEEVFVIVGWTSPLRYSIFKVACVEGAKV